MARIFEKNEFNSEGTIKSTQREQHELKNVNDDNLKMQIHETNNLKEEDESKIGKLIVKGRFFIMKQLRKVCFEI
jgi:hypothetical protein